MVLSTTLQLYTFVLYCTSVSQTEKDNYTMKTTKSTLIAGLALASAFSMSPAIAEHHKNYGSGDGEELRQLDNSEEVSRVHDKKRHGKAKHHHKHHRQLDQKFEGDGQEFALQNGERHRQHHKAKMKHHKQKVGESKEHMQQENVE